MPHSADVPVAEGFLSSSVTLPLVEGAVSVIWGCFKLSVKLSRGYLEVCVRRLQRLFGFADEDVKQDSCQEAQTDILRGRYPPVGREIPEQRPIFGIFIPTSGDRGDRLGSGQILPVSSQEVGKFGLAPAGSVSQELGLSRIPVVP